MKNSILFMALCGIMYNSVAFAGGGWPQPKGKGYFKISEWWMIADEHFTDVGLRDPNVTAGLFNTSVYAEYGLTHRMTGIIYAPIFSRSLFNNQISATSGEVIKQGEAINSLGDVNLAVKYGLTRPGASVAISATLLLGLPTGESAGGSDGALQTGDGEFNQLFQLDVGKSFGNEKLGLYGNIYSGINNRTNDFSDEFRYGVEFGVGLAASKLWLIGRLSGVESFRNGKSASEVATTSIFANNAEYMSLGIEANYYVLPKFGLSAGVTAPMKGEIVYAAPAYTVGIFFDMK